MLSKACEHAIRALSVIAHEARKGRRLGVREISALARSPEAFTAKILQTLVKQDILQSKKGPTGGFSITRDLHQVSLYEVITAIDGLVVFTKCGLGLDECNAAHPCPLHDQFAAVRSQFVDICRGETLASLVEELELSVSQR